MSDVTDVIVKGLLIQYPPRTHPITKKQIFNYIRYYNYDVSLLNEVVYKLYIRTYLSFKKEKTMHKNELKTRKDIEKRLDEWLMREYYRPPNVEGGPGYYETLNNFTSFFLWDTERKKE
tara:strand:+ start:1193 stop:1549 length:357 start_codon:yes stop_codon:yes gene_type:complete